VIGEPLFLGELVKRLPRDRDLGAESTSVRRRFDAAASSYSDRVDLQLWLRVKGGNRTGHWPGPLPDDLCHGAVLGLMDARPVVVWGTLSLMPSIFDRLWRSSGADRASCLKLLELTKFAMCNPPGRAPAAEALTRAAVNGWRLKEEPFNVTFNSDWQALRAVLSAFKLDLNIVAPDWDTTHVFGTREVNVEARALRRQPLPKAAQLEQSVHETLCQLPERLVRLLSVRSTTVLRPESTDAEVAAWWWSEAAEVAGDIGSFARLGSAKAAYQSENGYTRRQSEEQENAVLRCREAAFGDWLSGDPLGAAAACTNSMLLALADEKRKRIESTDACLQPEVEEAGLRFGLGSNRPSEHLLATASSSIGSFVERVERLLPSNRTWKQRWSDAAALRVLHRRATRGATGRIGPKWAALAARDWRKLFRVMPDLYTPDPEVGLRAATALAMSRGQLFGADTLNALIRLVVREGWLRSAASLLQRAADATISIDPISVNMFAWNVARSCAAPQSNPSTAEDLREALRSACAGLVSSSLTSGLDAFIVHEALLGRGITAAVFARHRGVSAVIQRQLEAADRAWEPHQQSDARRLVAHRASAGMFIVSEQRLMTRLQHLSRVTEKSVVAVSAVRLTHNCWSIYATAVAPPMANVHGIEQPDAAIQRCETLVHVDVRHAIEEILEWAPSWLYHPKRLPWATGLKSLATEIARAALVAAGRPPDLILIAADSDLAALPMQHWLRSETLLKDTVVSVVPSMAWAVTVPLKGTYNSQSTCLANRADPIVRSIVPRIEGLVTRSTSLTTTAIIAHGDPKREIRRIPVLTTEDGQMIVTEEVNEALRGREFAMLHVCHENRTPSVRPGEPGGLAWLVYGAGVRAFCAPSVAVPPELAVRVTEWMLDPENGPTVAARYRTMIDAQPETAVYTLFGLPDAGGNVEVLSSESEGAHSAAEVTTDDAKVLI
jgi:hypothetical protein